MKVVGSRTLSERSRDGGFLRSCGRTSKNSATLTPTSWTIKTMTTKNHDEFHIYLFGGAKGESIIINLPNGGWAVIDWYGRTSKNPRACSGLNLLTDHRVSTLEFVCLTHPHDDHYKGMSHLLREFHVKAFWSFGGFQPPDFRLLRTFFKGDAQSSGLKDAREN